MARFILVQNGGETVVELEDGEHTLGRSSQCAIKISDKAASREHCRIVVASGEMRLVDEGSRNGTLLNGRRATSEPLKPGDVIRIGDSVVHVERKRDATQQTSSRAAGTSVSLRGRMIVKDYAVWASGGWGWLGRAARTAGTALLVAVLAAVVAAVAFVLTRKPEGRGSGTTNLIGANPSFEADQGGALSLWRVEPDVNRVDLDRAAGRSGGGALVVDKTSPQPGLFLRADRFFDLERMRRVDAEIWARAEGFEGLLGFRIEWFERGERVILDDFSTPVQSGPGWILIRAGFNPPPSANRFRISLVAIGGVGRIFLDDAALSNRSPAQPSKAYSPSVGDYTFLTSPGTLNQVVTWKTLQVATNIHLELHGAKEGTIPALFASPVRPEEAASDRASFSGDLLGARGTIPVRQSIVFESGELSSTVKISDVPAQAFEEAHLVLDLPKADKVHLPESAYARSVGFTIGSHEFEIEYTQSVRVIREGGESEPVRLRHVFPVDGTVAVLGWRLRETSTTAELQIKKFRSDLARVGHERPGLRRSILRRLAAQLRDPEEIAEITKEIEEIGIREAAMWDQVRLEAKIAVVSGRPEKAASALRSITRFLDKFEDTDRAEQVDEYARTLMSLTAGTQEEDAKTGRTLLEAARKHVEAGKDDLAAGLLEVVAERWDGSELAQEARRLLETLGK